MFMLVIEDQPHCTGPDLRRKLVRRLAHDGSTFSGVGASNQTGAVQYACGETRKLLKANGITASMSRKGNCLDNAPMESFFGALKTELVHRTRFRTRREAKAVLFEYIEVFYNRQRRHSSVGYRTPAQARVDIATANAA